ncbi:hypothetical protein GOV11_00730, partial [Candidatus Woesearchaeota archaeon]|nr:hypothetical protein [Candidatus Woesearchaeota archaeon]
MRFWVTLMKNFKLLFRNKESAYTIVFGPLLIILLVSFAFMGASDEYTISVGIYDPGQTDLAAKSVNTLNKNNYLVSTYPRNESCIDSVRTGNTHACIVFSEVEAGDGTVPVTFYLDLSRINIAYQIIDDLSGEMDIQADAISKELASGTLTRIETAQGLLEEPLDNIPEVLDMLAELEDQLSQVQTAVSAIPSDYTKNITNVRQLKGYHLGMAQNTKEIAEQSEELLDDALKLIFDLEKKCENCSVAMEERIDILKEEVRDTKDSMRYIAEDVTDDQIFEANLLIEYAMEDLAEAEELV